MFETVERLRDFLINILVARGELIPEEMQQREIHLVGAVCIGGMDVRLYLGGVVIEDIEDVMTFMLIGANDAGIDGNMVGDQVVRVPARFVRKCTFSAQIGLQIVLRG